VNAAKTSLPDLNNKFLDLQGCWKETTGDGGQYTRNITPIFNQNTAARWVKAAMKRNQAWYVCIMFHGLQADGPASAQMSMTRGLSNLPLNDILTPTAQDMMENKNEQSADDAEMGHSNARYYPTTN
jgi:hypothetical protein